MAVLSKQGEEIWRVELMTQTLSYRTNGVVMRNRGAGWKIAGRKELGETDTQWRDRIEKIRRGHVKYANKRPWFEAFKVKFHKAVKLRSRGMLWAVINGVPERDCDALFGELDDYLPGEFSHEDCRVLMDAYNMLVLERKKRKEIRDEQV
jgi:hypothetical protein